MNVILRSHTRHSAGQCTGVNTAEELSGMLMNVGNTGLNWKVFAKELGLTPEQIQDMSVKKGHYVQHGLLKDVAGLVYVNKYH